MTLDTEIKGGGSKQDEIGTQANETTSSELKSVDGNLKASFIPEKNISANTCEVVLTRDKAVFGRKI